MKRMQRDGRDGDVLRKIDTIIQRTVQKNEKQ